MSVDRYIEKLETPAREIVAKLRKLILSVSPDVVEEIKWNSPTYSLTRNFCSVMAHRHHVNLQIFQGAHLKHADKLEGTGKNMRHLKFTDVKQLDQKQVRTILRQAVDFEQVITKR